MIQLGPIGRLGHWTATHFTGASGMWSDFNEANKSAMMKSELISWPVAAAGVMVAVLFTLALSGPLPPKEMGVILGVAVLLDAALVRLLLMPVLLRLLGEKAWWLPRSLDRVLPNVRFGHA